MNILITGGAASGKSAYAEMRAAELAEKKLVPSPYKKLSLIYVATLDPSSGGDTTERIQKHRRMRSGKNFITIECSGSLSSCAAHCPDSVVLLEDIGNAVANELFSHCNDSAGKAEEYTRITAESAQKAADSVLAGLRILRSSCSHLVAVTNELSSADSFVSDDVKIYEHTIGTVNCAWAAECDEVVEISAGVPVFLKR